ncbi:hypothetical protein [Pelagibius sp. Alg239-R121]|uniref:hypothetical protein n=1 Tax=Pelagibius sp. Alg239-R121 TaxID=2993448 RepID=UPI0024A67F46|nr:hypothetical protein [Pelagibius sp. Alg239-R121]
MTSKSVASLEDLSHLNDIVGSDRRIFDFTSQIILQSFRPTCPFDTPQEYVVPIHPKTASEALKPHEVNLDKERAID